MVHTPIYGRSITRFTKANIMNKLKERFLICMTIMYPNGVSNIIQHRDLVRVFTMSWVEALLHNNQSEAVQELVADYDILANEEWLPDESWQWW